MKDAIVVRGARQHNLKGFDLRIPRRAFTVVTGPSGSGKSSLAFDTIYAEGQRRYVESLSAYARQFLERMEKPDVDSVDGLSPAVAIEQKNPTKTSRSTVGTATEIYDYLRLLWARIGRTFCPLCGREMKPDTVQSVADAVAALPAGTRYSVTPPRFSQPAVRWRFTERFECANDGTRAPSPTPQLFSFNSPRGACSRCNGFGATLEYDESLIVPYPDRSLRDGAIDPWRMPRYENKRRALAEFAKRERIPTDVAWQKLSEQQRHKLLHARARGYKGIFPFLSDLEEKRYKQYIRVFLRQYQSARQCPDCGGAKLQPASLQVRVDGRTIAEVSELPVDRLLDWLSTVSLNEFERQVAAHILKEARDRVQFLCDVGLNYLTLNRATRTLSGGEAQRIGLANSLGSQLVDTLYVLDEPSIGLHPRDTDRLLRLLHRLRDAGNTVIVVEHDPETIRAADYMVELGPASGERGGQVVFSGPMSRISESPLTGAYLTGKRDIPLPTRRRRLGPQWLTLTGAREHNL